MIAEVSGAVGSSAEGPDRRRWVVGGVLAFLIVSRVRLGSESLAFTIWAGDDVALVIDPERGLNGLRPSRFRWRTRRQHDNAAQPERYLVYQQATARAWP